MNTCSLHTSPAPEIGGETRMVENVRIGRQGKLEEGEGVKVFPTLQASACLRMPENWNCQELLQDALAYCNKP